ncbi:hypothetical protein PZ938_19035 [Luteipulveratus sp. YIM 133132]|uniref:hypothetical protein n=1 Tax=Luteipulveratus flavus TaxID=3031728 RepID=UPI0023AF0535|nr:hypothetical protein [Luteipulveratus sp. YIM 133132]MDE9367718.1 hypothetical protein [Luteipulveratus sp. YIM 133132]
MEDLLDATVGENAAWCAAVCRTHDIAGSDADRVWASARRTPLLYPDAITLEPGRSPEAVLGRVDTSAGCSVKDSHADLDLGAHGFRVLLEGRWLTWPGVPESDGWVAVRSAETFATWLAAWGGPDGVLVPALLDDPSVSVLARYDGDLLVAGLIGHRADRVAGLSNAFGLVSAADWRAAVGAVQVAAPGLPVVGYESGDDLDPALDAGARDLGPLRVWLR